MTADAQPLILACVADLIFASQIEAVARRLGFRVQWVESAAQIERGEAQDQPGEPLVGVGSGLIRLVSATQPALILFDLSHRDIPWEQWLALLKTSPATRRTPVLCFGPHVAADKLAQAHNLGADGVVARRRFSQALPDLLQQYARRPNYPAVATACAEALDPRARHGIALFNAGQYFEAHEELELAWRADDGPGRDLYRAILQIGVAYLQIERGNFRGALKMFLRVRQWLEPLPAVCRSVDVAELRASAAQVQAALEALGPDALDQFDRALFKPVRLV